MKLTEKKMGCLEGILFHPRQVLMHLYREKAICFDLSDFGVWSRGRDAFLTANQMFRFVKI
jgi:hypothetical protein